MDKNGFKIWNDEYWVTEYRYPFDEQNL